MITLYDLARPGTRAMSDSEQCWSGNTLSYALNIKGLPFNTEWVKFADVETKIKSLDAEPSQDGFFAYTVPTIIDSSTQQVISDSFAIAQYLDKAYPNTPALIPTGTAAFQRALVDKVVVPMILTALPGLVGPVCDVGCFDEADRLHYRKTREALFGGKPLEDILKMGNEGMGSACKAYREGLNEIAEYAKEAGGDGVFFGGREPWFTDTVVAAALIFTLKTCGKEHPLSAVILSHEWACRLVAAFEKWN